MTILKTLLPIAALFALAAGTAAQSAAVVPYGSSCTQGGLAAPTIGHRGLPRLGTSFDITYSGPNFAFSSAQQRVQPLLITGFGTAQLPIGPVLPLQAPGCSLLVTPDLVLPMPTDPRVRPAYVDHFTWTIPNDSALIGGVFFQQWLALFSQCGIASCDPMWVANSEGAIVHIGT